MSDPLNDSTGTFLVDPQRRAAAQELKARYFYYVDTRQWGPLRDLFVPDARFEGYAFGHDVETWMVGVEKFLDGRISMHHGCMPMLRAESDSLIRARWSMRDFLTWTPGSRSFPGSDAADLSGFDGYGYYEDQYRLTDDGWKIAFMRLTRLRVDLLHGTPEPVRAEFPRPVLEWLP